MGVISVLLVTKENDIIELTCLGVTNFYNANEDKYSDLHYAPKDVILSSIVNHQLSVRKTKNTVGVLYFGG